MLLTVLFWYYAQIQSGNTSPEIVQDYITTEALVMGVDPQIAQGIVKRESRFNVKAIGDHGESRGAWQIHMPAHKDITPAQAEDIVFSTTWSLREIKQNGCKIWSTCQDTMKSLVRDD